MGITYIGSPSTNLLPVGVAELVLRPLPVVPLPAALFYLFFLWLKPRFFETFDVSTIGRFFGLLCGFERVDAFLPSPVLLLVGP